MSQSMALKIHLQRMFTTKNEETVLADSVESARRAFCHEVYINAGTDWLTFRYQILLILHDMFLSGI